ncbi:MAG: hypothetical protein QNK37_05140 [Acidobacteriota bacterium]|nr:hypothetical protein [Acidobacteriota bacterium]
MFIDTDTPFNFLIETFKPPGAPDLAQIKSFHCDLQEALLKIHFDNLYRELALLERVPPFLDHLRQHLSGNDSENPLQLLQEPFLKAMLATLTHMVNDRIAVIKSVFFSMPDEERARYPMPFEEKPSPEETTTGFTETAETTSGGEASDRTSGPAQPSQGDGQA